MGRAALGRGGGRRPPSLTAPLPPFPQVLGSGFALSVGEEAPELLVDLWHHAPRPLTFAPSLPGDRSVGRGALGRGGFIVISILRGVVGRVV